MNSSAFPPHLQAAGQGLPEHFFSRLDPAPLPEPRLLAVSRPAARLLGLDAEQLMLDPHSADYFSGNRRLPGSTPLAMVYSGHQFGIWAGQLGDGRAHLLGCLDTPNGRWELQLKGAGPTPYARGADGRAVLRSSIREFLCSEAMAGLGIPTTRALCLVGAPHPVLREQIETAAVVTRLAPSFLRFGSLEHWAARGRLPELKHLADHIIATAYPECAGQAQPYRALLAAICQRTAELLAAWMSVGFMHGVMNTDNMSVLGLTLDYGPFGFMESFDADHICNHSDHWGRYSYRNQPRIAQWNLACLAHALQALIGDPAQALETVDQSFGTHYDAAFLHAMRRKIGQTTARADDAAFVAETLDLLQAQRIDFSHFFRQLCALPQVRRLVQDDAPVRDLFVERAAADHWLAKWRQRLSTDLPDTERQAAMRQVNPRFILRNWLAETAIRAAQAGDLTYLHRLLDCLHMPYSEQPEYAEFAAGAPDWASQLSISCSS